MVLGQVSVICYTTGTYYSLFDPLTYYDHCLTLSAIVDARCSPPQVAVLLEVGTFRRTFV